MKSLFIAAAVLSAACATAALAQSAGDGGYTIESGGQPAGLDAHMTRPGSIDADWLRLADIHSDGAASGRSGAAGKSQPSPGDR